MVAWAVSLGTVFFGAKATSAVFLGPTTEATKDAHESPPTMIWGMGLLAAGSVILGVAPQLAVNYLLNPILLAFRLTVAQVTWFGLSADAGSFSTVGGLVLAVVSIVLGGLIYAIAYAARPATVAATVSGGAALVGAGGGIFTGGEPLSSEDRLTASDFSSIFLQNWREFFRWTNVDAVYLGVWRGLQAVSRAARRYRLLDGAQRAGAGYRAGRSGVGGAFAGLLPALAAYCCKPLPRLRVPSLLVAACAVAGSP